MIKVLSLALVGLFMFVGIASADVLSDPPSGTTEGTNWQTPITPLNNFLNQYANHEHRIPARENPLGLGFDVTYDFNETFATAVEYRYDTRNEEHSTYLVGKISLNSLFK